MRNFLTGFFHFQLHKVESKHIIELREKQRNAKSPTAESISSFQEQENSILLITVTSLKLSNCSFKKVNK
jgi:hypothetical protein